MERTAASSQKSPICRIDVGIKAHKGANVWNKAVILKRLVVSTGLLLIIRAPQKYHTKLTELLEFISDNLSFLRKPPNRIYDIYALLSRFSDVGFDVGDLQRGSCGQ